MQFLTYCQTRLAGVCARRHENGAAMVEYALLLALIAMVCLLAMFVFGEEMSSKYESIAESIDVLPQP